MRYGLLIIFSCGVLAATAQPGRLLRGRNFVEDQSEIRKGEDLDEKLHKNFFLKAEVSKTTCFVGEPVMATFKAYSRLNANSKVLQRPALTGFSVLEMVDSYNNDPEAEMVNGKMFNSHLIRKVQLFPLQEGRFSLEPAEVESQIFLRNPNMVKYLTLETPPIAITVKPLPLANQPDSFSGAVGNFSVYLEMKDKDVYQYDPATVSLVVKGTGNFPLITDPEITWPAGMTVSPPQVTEEVDKYQYPLSGSKRFEYTLETDDTGSYTIPPIRFSYFDPAAAKYKTTATSEISFEVKKGRKKSAYSAPIIQNAGERPLQYYYFAVIGAGILGWIIFQIVRSRRQKSDKPD